LPKWWSDADYLRFLSNLSYNEKLAVKQIITHIKYMESFRDKVLGEDAAELLRKGGVTIMGRDKKGQSNIVLNLDRTPKINKKNVEALIEA